MNNLISSSYFRNMVLKDNIKQKIGDSLILNYDTLKENKPPHKSKIDVKCSSCDTWVTLSLEAIYRRKSENRLPYFCQPCTMSKAMNRPEVKEKCKKNSKTMWQDYNDIKQATGDTEELKSKLDDLLSGPLG